MKTCQRMCGFLSVVAFVAAMGDPGTAAGSVWVNDGCPAVGPAESGAQCLNNTDDDGDEKVNDGCPHVGAAPEAGAQCDNNTDNDAADDHGACCDTPDNLCFQLTEPECKALGFTFRGYGTPCGSNGTCIPTLSEWDVAVMALLVLTAATVVIMRRRAAA